MKNINYIFLILGLMIAVSATADDVEDPCTVKNGGAMAANMCIEKDLLLSDKNLNIEYQSAIARIKDEEKYMGIDLVENFLDSQRAWLNYRDSYCEFEGDSTGAAGGWASYHISQCILKMNKERTEYFRVVFVG